jgi:hypothetical protein
LINKDYVENIYKLIFCYFAMGTYPPDPRKRKLDYNIAQNIYDDFAKACSRKGFAPQVILEKLMAKFNETGQV